MRPGPSRKPLSKSREHRFDTSVLYAALTFEHGVCGRIVRKCIERANIVISDYILIELERHLSGKGRIPADQVTEALEILRESSRLVVPDQIPADACRDPNDLPILGTASAAKAIVLVSGGKDLLVLGQFRGIPIVTPRDFSDRFLSLIEEAK